jgi:protocatechuate 3,4-dioxygenase, beta subunit
MRQNILLLLLCYSISSCGQNNAQIKSEQKGARVGGPCEGCEAIYENKVPFGAMNEVDTLPIFGEQGPALVVSGVVYRSDGKTPAPGVVLYVYQTDRTGKYRVTGNETGWARRHGSIRGWMKTNERGEYRFYTIRPASYSETGPPAHVHVFVKEPDKNEYYIDDFQFDDDPTLTPEMRRRQHSRGGDGILKLQEKGGIYYGRRNIILGRNVADYPTTSKASASRTVTIGMMF